MKNQTGEILYIGKATSLRSRVSSYFLSSGDRRLAKMVGEIKSIDYIETATAIEALMLEAKLIKKYQPHYNVLEKDDRSFIYLAFSKENFPKPILIREHELKRMSNKQFIEVLGPFVGSKNISSALDTLRPIFPWTKCKENSRRPCFYRHLNLCPGVCSGEISSIDYKKIIKALVRFLKSGQKSAHKFLFKQMNQAAQSQNFESAAKWRDRMRGLKQIKDFNVIKENLKSFDQAINIFGRIEGYDVSNSLGQNAVGSLVVFEDGAPKKSAYRIFSIKTISTPNDLAMLEEVLMRRFTHSDWPKPDLLVIDGGVGQVNIAKKVLLKFNLKIAVVGLAKGPDRKKDELVYDKSNFELMRLAETRRDQLRQVRDEAHRFAIAKHRQKRRKNFLI